MEKGIRKFVKINISGNCNLSCSYCFGFKFKEIAADAIEKIEAIMENYDAVNSCFRVECTGEITLYPEILEYLNNKCRNEGYNIEVLSNGTKIKEFINKYGYLNWVLSLDGHTVEMNRFRKLSEIQIVNILDVAVLRGAELQCVFFKQSIEDINGFINYLGERNYKGFLNIFPCRFSNSPLTIYLDYDKLVKADFLPDKEYFRRWKVIYDTGRRDFACDVFENGYTYRINSDGIKKIKCECAGSIYKELRFDEPEEDYCISKCGNCFTHYEYNNIRKLVSG